MIIPPAAALAVFTVLSVGQSEARPSDTFFYYRSPYEYGAAMVDADADFVQEHNKPRSYGPEPSDPRQSYAWPYYVNPKQRRESQYRSIVLSEPVPDYALIQIAKQLNPGSQLNIRSGLPQDVPVPVEQSVYELMAEAMMTRVKPWIGGQRVSAEGALMLSQAAKALSIALE